MKVAAYTPTVLQGVGLENICCTTSRIPLCTLAFTLTLLKKREADNTTAFLKNNVQNIHSTRHSDTLAHILIIMAIYLKRKQRSIGLN